MKVVLGKQPTQMRQKCLAFMTIILAACFAQELFKSICKEPVWEVGGKGKKKREKSLTYPLFCHLIKTVADRHTLAPDNEDTKYRGKMCQRHF